MYSDQHLLWCLLLVNLLSPYTLSGCMIIHSSVLIGSTHLTLKIIAPFLCNSMWCALRINYIIHFSPCGKCSKILTRIQQTKESSLFLHFIICDFACMNVDISELYQPFFLCLSAVFSILFPHFTFYFLCFSIHIHLRFQLHIFMFPHFWLKWSWSFMPLSKKLFFGYAGTTL